MKTLLRSAFGSDKRPSIPRSAWTIGLNSRFVWLFAIASLLAACASGPPPPDWQINAHGAMERATSAYLSGDPRVEALEFERARAETARTGRADLLARVELARCATRVASLVFEPCAGYAALHVDAGAVERAYARYLEARIEAGDVALLPEHHRAVAAMVVARRSDASLMDSLRNIADPLARLVAAGVLLRAGLAHPSALELASDAASAQGWRRPLLAWLGAQERLATQAGAVDVSARLRRRMELLQAAPTKP